VIAKYMLAWFPMVFIAILNGILRESVIRRFLGEPASHRLSTLTGAIFFGLYIQAVIRIWKPESGGQAVAIGLLWLVMTIAFEFLFGHYVAGHSWSRLLLDYNLFAGRVWLLLLAWVAAAPWIFYRLNR
jgi:hypothetical protein